MKKTVYTLLLCLPALLCACSSHNGELAGNWESQQPPRLTAEESAGERLGFAFSSDGTFIQRVRLTDKGMPMATAVVTGKWEYLRGSKLRQDFTALVRLDYDVSSVHAQAMSPAISPYNLQSWERELAARFASHNERQDNPPHNLPVYALRVTRLSANLLMIDTPQGNVRLQRL